MASVFMQAERYFYGRSGDVRQRCYTSGTIDLISSTDTEATFRLQGNFRYKNDPTIIYDPAKPVSDFFVITTANPASYPFSTTADYYQKNIPTPAENNLLVFRIDATSNTPPYSNNLWIRPNGQVLTASTATVEMGQEGSIFPIDCEFTVPKTGNTIPVLYTASSNTGIYSTSTTEWIGIKEFEYTFDIPPASEYRPGAVYDGTSFKSCNRTNGKCNIYNGTQFVEMSTVAGGNDNPPLIFNGTQFVNMGKSGDE